MRNGEFHRKSGLAFLTLAALFCPGKPARAQSAPEQRERRAPNLYLEQDRAVEREELANFDRFLDSHREIAEQVRKNPSLVVNAEFVRNHPALQAYLEDHAGVRQQLKENPSAFLRQEERYNRREGDRYRLVRRELASFDRFLDNHRETAEPLRKNPSLVEDKEFVESHPALLTYLEDHPEVREELRRNPNAFLEAEIRFDRREDDLDRYRRDADFDRSRRTDDMDRDLMRRHFGEFLGGHRELAQQLSTNPSLVRNQGFLENHPELQEYLNANPSARQELMANPQAFVRASQPFAGNGSQSAKPPGINAIPNR